MFLTEIRQFPESHQRDEKWELSSPPRLALPLDDTGKCDGSAVPGSGPARVQRLRSAPCGEGGSPNGSSSEPHGCCPGPSPRRVSGRAEHEAPQWIPGHGACSHTPVKNFGAPGIGLSLAVWCPALSDGAQGWGA